MTVRLLAIGVLCAFGFLCVGSATAAETKHLYLKANENDIKGESMRQKTGAKQGSAKKDAGRMGGGGGAK